MPVGRLAALLVLLAIGAAAAAEAPPGTPASVPPGAAVTTRHAIDLAGRRLDYQAIAETLQLVDAKSNPTAVIFTVAYLAEQTTAAPRPVSFVFNGGPGAASVFLHLGALGPRILATPENGGAPQPPFRLVDNEASWLAFTDLVFVDPVGTGFSRGVGKAEDADKAFFDVHADLDSLAATIRLWLTRHARWRSPVYLVGESYGGFRAAALAQMLPRDDNATPSGLVLISPALDLSGLNPGPRDLLASAFLLPSYARVAAAWKPAPGGDIAAVERFALGDYLTGLAALKGRPPAADPLIGRIAAFAGLPEAGVRRHRGRIPRQLFVRELRRPENEVISVYDGTIARPAVGGSAGGDAADPLLRPAAAAFGAAFNAYASEELGYRTDRPYRVLAREVSREWDWQDARRGDRAGLALEGLQQALLEHPKMRVLVAAGTYDLVTPYFGTHWLVEQLQLPAASDAVLWRLYPGGHMPYLRPETRRAMSRDAAQIYPPPPPLGIPVPQAGKSVNPADYGIH